MSSAPAPRTATVRRGTSESTVEVTVDLDGSGRFRAAVPTAPSLGTPVALPPAPPPKGPHNIGGRVAALLGSCGLYGLWWLYDVMVQGNDNFHHDWVREDAFLVALGA